MYYRPGGSKSPKSITVAQLFTNVQPVTPDGQLVSQPTQPAAVQPQVCPDAV